MDSLANDIRLVLRNGYLDDAIDLSGPDEVRKYLKSKGHKYLPGRLAQRCDDEVRKGLEADGYTPTNPTARNGYRRTLAATDEQVVDSLITRQATTRTRRRRDEQQARNLAPKLTDPVAQAVVAAAAKIDEAQAEADAVRQQVTAELFRAVLDAK